MKYFLFYCSFLLSILGIFISCFFYFFPFHSKISLQFIDDFELPQSLLSFSGTRIGGLSALYYDETTKLLYALSDDPGDPNIKERSGPRFYQFEVSLTEKKLSLQPRSVTFIRKQGKQIPPGTFDLEAWIPLASGNFILSSEGQHERVRQKTKVSTPLFFEMNQQGEVLQEFSLGEKFTPTDWSQTKGLSPEQGIETLFLLPKNKPKEKEKFISITESSLYQDKSMSPPHLRISLYDFPLSSPLQSKKEWVYVLDPFPNKKRLGFTPTIEINGVTDGLALSENSFLVIERGFYTDQKSHYKTGIRIEKVDISPLEEKNTPTEKIFSLLKHSNQLKEVKKECILDLDAILSKLKPPTHPVQSPLDNIEGITWGPIVEGKRTILLVSDDNFNSTQRTLFLAFFFDK